MKELYLDENVFSGTEEEFLAVENFKVKGWYKNGERHRIDGPAVIYSNGTQEWCQNGKFHRADGPARIYPDGSQAWCQNGIYHRIDGPAVIYSYGRKYWYIEGLGFCNFFDQFFPIKNFTKDKYPRE